jgi:hypothetical protein
VDAVCCLLILALSWPAAGQTTEPYTYGNRPIDKLPNSHYAQPEDQRDWGEPAPEGRGVLLHPKGLFRIGERGIERLCVVEAWVPKPSPQEAAYRLLLVEPPDHVLWDTWPDWLGPNRRMRPYWLPVGSGGRQHLDLAGPGGLGGMPSAASTEVDLTAGAPRALIEWTGLEAMPEVDAGLALLPGDDMVPAPRGHCRFRVVVRQGLPGSGQGELRLSSQAQGIQAWYPPVRQTVRLAELARATTLAFDVYSTPTQAPTVVAQSVQLVYEGQVLARASRLVCPRSFGPEITFGAREADLRYALPIRDGGTERSWYELWGHSDKRDVVVSFPDSDARFVFWRGASYVGCWAFPEAWLCYEWLEAEPYFYGAVDCVEPIMDKDCRYSKAEIVSSSPARAVVKWSYALTDFEGKIIRDEHAEETFTFYPDGIGTRFLRGFYTGGWHENQEFIVINRPGRWPSQALDPQAITFLSPSGERQDPVWPKPGFSVAGWPQVISIVHLGNGPYPFMVTPDAPSQVKVWADPYLDKPDLSNSYPHWPVTRGMLTSWLTDPADFARPTHSNLANLVSEPIRETPGEKDFVWLIGVCSSEQQALDAARCWLKPGRIEPHEGLASAEYSQTERAYILRPTPDARTVRFTLVPEEGVPVVNPAFIVEGWEGAVMSAVSNAKHSAVGHEERRTAVWVEGRFGDAWNAGIDRP